MMVGILNGMKATMGTIVERRISEWIMKIRVFKKMIEKKKFLGEILNRLVLNQSSHILGYYAHWAQNSKQLEE